MKVYSIKHNCKQQKQALVFNTFHATNEIRRVQTGPFSLYITEKLISNLP
jgi:hypothetical protein